MGKYKEFIKSTIEKYKKELEDLKEAISIMEKAGEDVTHLKIELSHVEDMLERWKKATEE